MSPVGSPRWVTLLKAAALVVLAFGVLAVAVLAVPRLMTASFSAEDAERFKAMADVRNSLVAALVMVFTGGTLAYTARTFRLTQMGQLRAQFESAAKQMATGDEAVRMAGVYSMAQLADGWLDQRQACIEVLCAHVRLPGVPGAAAVNSRTTAVRVIAEHLRPSPRVGLWRRWLFGTQSRPDWCSHTFDLSGIRLDQPADFHGAQLSGGRMLLGGPGVELGDLCFDDLVLEHGAQLRLDGTRLTAAVTFTRARIEGASVTFTGSRVESGARLTFVQAHLGSGTDPALSLEDATLSSSEAVSFEGATVEGEVRFDGAHLDTPVTFRHAELMGHAQLTFRGTVFARGVDFEAAGDHGAVLVLDEETASMGGHLDLTRMRSGPPRIQGREPGGLVISGPAAAGTEAGRSLLEGPQP